MASLASQLIEEVTAHAQKDRLEDAREICSDGTYFPNNLRSTDLLKINPLMPNDPYRGRTAPLTSKVAFYIFIQQI